MESTGLRLGLVGTGGPRSLGELSRVQRQESESAAAPDFLMLRLSFSVFSVFLILSRLARAVWRRRGSVLVTHAARTQLLSFLSRLEPSLCPAAGLMLGGDAGYLGFFFGLYL